MLSLQELIHKFEEGEGVRHVRLAAVFLGLLGLTVLYDIREFKSFSTQEAMDSAQLARNIAEGRGYSTQFIRPLSILLLQRQEPIGVPVLMKETHADLANPPVYPFMLAGLMKALPFRFEIGSGFTRYQPEMLITLFNQALFFASIVLVFRLGRRLFDTGVAWISAIIFAGADLFWRFSVSGLSTMLLVFLMLVLLWCLVVMEQNHREPKRSAPWFVGMAVAVGLIVGLGALTRYSFGWLIIPVVAFLALYFDSRRFALMGAATVVFLLVLAPWVARNYSVSQTLFGTAGYAAYHGTEPFSGDRLERFLGSEFDEQRSLVGPSMFLRKLLVNTSDIFSDEVPRIGGTWLTAFFLVSLFVPFRNQALNRLRVFLVLSLATLTAAQALGRTYLSSLSPEVNSENLLVLLAPLIFVYGTGLFFVLLDQLELPYLPLRTGIIGAFSLVMCAPLVFTLLPPRSSSHVWPPYWPPYVQKVGGWLSPAELMMSDMPWAVAWYGDRKCVWLTLDAPSDSVQNAASDFFEIYDYQKPISGLYLTHLTLDARFSSDILHSPNWAWGRFVVDSYLKEKVPSGFPLKAGNKDFWNNGQLFLSDRERWIIPPK